MGRELVPEANGMMPGVRVSAIIWSGIVTIPSRETSLAKNGHRKCSDAISMIVVAFLTYVKALQSVTLHKVIAPFGELTTVTTKHN
jgi:hypothetical protein